MYQIYNIQYKLNVLIILLGVGWLSFGSHLFQKIIDTGIEDALGAHILVYVLSASAISSCENAWLLTPSSMISCASTINLFFKATSSIGSFLQKSKYKTKIKYNDLPNQAHPIGLLISITS